ncbi:glutamyl-tRNA(Gln) amidotransferase subunit B, mitochondrial [Alosa sapidissima]|uniref:glutamyl-tRNA(Gln) amidotransferase subunit B, mitochondrial n=1 Tax=Alosa sapidissima TaxID=34773 RepID=UPI001C09A33E|nr:glutamyl-tRNA(Gln) amidotransferase subunit B, mitochondrial [Alosa sapidissima]
MEDNRQEVELRSDVPISPPNGETLCTQEHNQVKLTNGQNHASSPVNGVQEYRRHTFSTEPTLEDIRRMQAEFTDERDWNQFHQPRNLLLAMVGEVGEVSELFQWRGEVAEGLPDWTESEREHLAQELSDVLIYLVELAEKCHVDLPQAVLRKMALNRQKYPASKVHGSAKKYTEYNE